MWSPIPIEAIILLLALVILAVPIALFVWLVKAVARREVQRQRVLDQQQGEIESGGSAA